MSAAINSQPAKSGVELTRAGDGEEESEEGEKRTGVKRGAGRIQYFIPILGTTRGPDPLIKGPPQATSERSLNWAIHWRIKRRRSARRRLARRLTRR